MAEVALDSNILLYALLEPETRKGVLAERVVNAFAGGGVLTAQAMAETLAVVRRKRPDLLDNVAKRLADLRTMYEVGPTTRSALGAAESLVLKHGFQVYDAIIVAASAEAGAHLLLSEDMQDGLRIAGLRILNPFSPANRAEIDALLA